MKWNQLTVFQRSAVQLLFGLIGLALATFVSLRLGLDLATTALAYLTLVVLLSLIGSFVASAVLSLIAVVSLNWFFVPPHFSFHVDFPLDIAAPVAFLLSSLLVSGLMARNRRLTEAAFAGQQASRRAEQALREQASLLDVTHDAIFVRDFNDAITYWNRGAEDLYGWSRAEAVGKVTHELLQTRFPQPLAAIKEELLRGGRWEGELVHTARDGTKIVVATRWSIQQDERGRALAILETNNDITQYKRADAELRESERRYRTIFQTIEVSIWEEDFSSVKAAIDDLKAEGVSDFRRYLGDHPEFVRQAIAMVRIVDVNDATLRLFGARNKNELLDSFGAIFLPESESVFAGELIAVAEGRHSYEAEADLQTLQGKKLAVLFSMTFPPEPTDLKSVLVSIVDITERKRSQDALNKAQAELAHVNRVASLGQLSASIAHEVNQPIAGVVTNAEAALRWLAAQPPDLEEIRQALDDIVKDGQRAGQILSRIRALVKKEMPHKDLLDINQTVVEVIAVARAELQRNGVSLLTRLEPGLPAVSGDRVQLQQIILNLILNAVEAMSAIEMGLRHLTVGTESADSGEIVVAVRDSGPGLDPAHLGSLFEPFFTTKPDGMGMGLSICSSIVEAHGGRLWATPNLPHGAIFQFTLPVQTGGTA